MKKYIYILSLSSLLGLSGCSLDAFPGGDIITEDQKEDLLAKNPEKIEADINGLAANMIKLNTLELSKTQHFDFGYPAICMMFDSSSADMTAFTSGYNHFSSPQLFRDRSVTSYNSEVIWRMSYSIIKGANDVLTSIETLYEATDSNDKGAIKTLNYYKAQSLSYRAFSYMLLAQTFQFTYVGHEDAPSVPLILVPGDERNTDKRASVSDVYAVILDDLNISIELLKENSLPRGLDKSKVSLEVAYGLRARANLIMNKWEDAAKDAKAAQIGFIPYSLKEVSQPTFNSAASKSWMWANMITKDTNAGGSNIINWPSHLCSMAGGAYTTMVGAYRSINLPLWKSIPESDIRKQWWLDEDTHSVLVDDMLIDSEPIAEAYGWEPLVNVKFHAFENIPGNSVKASDWPIMRVEEMIFIEAEALAMSGDIQGAKSLLTDFIKANRNPEYTCKATTAVEMQDEIWYQRRLELWGEGFSLFDTLRLKKPIERIVKNEEGKFETSFPSSAQYNVKAEDQILIYMLPEKEIEGNPLLESSDNNPSGIVPQPAKLEK
ncbi:hypothetical protein Bcop_0656 [Bacteroides coprosuis DSM 18011]|uniref:RagB/SusD domain-containing protein n=1 Tax=Bacteroides coprosuis DSM 18011 TaxID=679937 RepID=F3ZSD7_9BACE|nr:RagB/SusD family nutrient uptake outer membrane protein [Bacteroides coprosuis]EGJ70874.1 hypothetical protein Bcop_0656 [Bacteroides coprosuis DSM 18011]